MRKVKFFKKYEKNLYLICLFLILSVNLIFRIIFVYYGYISTEEGTLLINQKLAYSGKVPFLNYDAWNSLTNDYLIGWVQLFIAPSILSQRLIGLILAITVLLITLKIASNLGGRLLVILTAVLMTFGSYTYLYISNIPYSAQVSTFLTITSLLLLSINIRNKKDNTLISILSLLFMTAATVNLIQSLPALILLILYLLFIYRFNIQKLVQISIPSLIYILAVASPFFKNIDYLIYSLTWPFKADKILIYQASSNLKFSNIILFFQELFRDYLVFVCVILAGVLTQLISLRNKNRPRLSNEKYMLLLFLIGLSFALTGLVHKPPSASYINLSVPILSLLAAWIIFKLLQIINTRTAKTYLLIIIGFLLFNNFLNYSHYKLMKTSWSTIDKTPHYYLNQVSQIIKDNSEATDKILSFYTPVVIGSGRQPIDNFNRDRFSMSLLDNTTAEKHKLINNQILLNTISSKTPKIIIFSDTNIMYFGPNHQEQDNILKKINANYTLIEKYDNFNKIEDPKSGSLYVYLRKD